MNEADILINIVGRSFGERVVTIELLAGGVNSIVYKISTGVNKKYIVKKYISQKGDLRDRLSIEFSGLTFLWSQGLKNIPQPLYMDRINNLGIYSFIEGEKLHADQVSIKDIHATADFVRCMHSLVNSKDADIQPLASESCFRIRDYVECVEMRLKNLKSYSANIVLLTELQHYLDTEFIPYYTYIKEQIRKLVDDNRLNMDTEIPKYERTLSSSDFGFHNIIKNSEGTLFFIDFEYYGWDDLAKLIGDFYHQPAIPVPYEFREVFYKDLQDLFGSSKLFKKRLSLIYPLLGFKWCLVMLNPFYRLTTSQKGIEDICLKQLDKSRSKLDEIRREVETKAFPISLNT